MNIPENEELINYLVVLAKPGRKSETVNDTRWGELILPDPSENPDKTGDGLKVVLLGSWQFGYLVLETLKEYERKFPEKLNLVGFVTDHPLNPDAKISVKKRIWNMLDMPSRVIDEATIIESGLSHGIPVYTGEIKIDSFHQLLHQWNPDAILVSVFGQIIDSFTIQIPSYGIYNFHPSDLTRHHGAGPAPYEDLAVRNAATTVWSVHHVSEEIDGGHVIGQSPQVNVLNTRGILPSDPLIVYNKLAEALSPLVYFLIGELCTRFEMNKIGSIEQLDFPALFPSDIKKKLMEPITRDESTDVFLFPDKSLFL
ncbi:MAG: formyltransferase family protein [Deltaproteobacteria bacterium]|nr:formyltransferase family protein [Deltaproteobacteria bacterium]